MKKEWIYYGLGMLLLMWGCGENNSVPNPPNSPTAPCSQLDTLVGQIESFSTLLTAPAVDPNQIDRELPAILDGLRRNQNAADSCNYLDGTYFPDHLRFDFVGHLTQWAIRDTIPLTVRYLVKLRGIFIDDTAISEFFSEEIARIALRNPIAYQTYFNDHPAQQQMLLNSTQWRSLNLDDLIANFENIAPQPRIHQYLLGMRTLPSAP